MIVQPPSSSSAAASLSPEEERKIRFLKAVCIGLGVLIVLALGAVIVGFLAGGKKSAPEKAMMPPAASVVPQPPAEVGNAGEGGVMPVSEAIDVALATGQTVRQVSLDGNRLVVLAGRDTSAAG